MDHERGEEKINWKAEYVARNADISIHWLRSHTTEASKTEIHGASTCNGGRSLFTVLDDGKVGIWDVNPYGSRAGRRISWRGSGEASVAGTVNPSNSHIGFTETISVDDARGKAYVAAGQTVVGVDVRTLVPTERVGYTRAVTAMSTANDAGIAMTIATDRGGLYLHDPRSCNNPAPVTGFTQWDRPSVLSILHRGPHAIHVAGRFPSIVTYDRRFLSKVHSTIWTGARALSSLSNLPPSQTYPHGGILAAGHGKSRTDRGFVNVHHPDPMISSRDGTSATHESKNNDRTMWCEKSVMYAIPHGCRIVCSDVAGQLFWVERDGGPVQRQCSLRSMNDEYDSPQIGSKIMRLGCDADDPRADLAVRTGTDVGIIGFGAKKDVNGGLLEGEEEEEEKPESEEDDYRETMRRNLHKQFEDTRYLNSFGLFPTYG